MPSALARHWRWMALRGALLIVFGALMFLWPITALFTLVLMYGIFAFLDGFSAFTLASRSRKANPSARTWPLVLLGVLGLLAGIAAFVWPGLTALILVVLIAFWAIIRGILEIVVAIELRKEIKGELFMILGALASILFGVLVLARPGVGALAMVWLIGSFALVVGIATLAASLKLRRASHRAESAAA